MANAQNAAVLSEFLTMAPILSSLIDVSLTLHTAWNVQCHERFENCAAGAVTL